MLTRCICRTASLAFAIGCPSIALATDGTWTNITSGGQWSNTTNWSGGTVAIGTDGIADFSTLNITADNTLHLDAPRTIGQLKFGDTTPSNNWILDNNSNNTNILTLAVTSASPTITVNNQTATISAVMSGSQGLLKAGAGQLTLGAAETYTGATTISAGTLLAGIANALPTSSALTDTGTFNLGGFNQSIGSLTGSGTVTTTGSSGSDTLTVGNDNSSPLAFTGAITNASGGRAVAVTKNGTGTLTLGGTNTCTGSLTVNGGTLELNSTGIITAAGPTNIGTGVAGTMTLDGGSASFSQTGSAGVAVGNAGTLTGTLNIGTFSNGAAFSTGTGIGALTINKTGIVNIGNGAITGTLNANGDVVVAGVLRCSSGSTFNLGSGNKFSTTTGASVIFAGTFTTPTNGNTTYTFGDGSFTAGATTVNASNTFTISGGTVNLGTLTWNAGTIILTSGSLSFGGDLTVGVGGMLGPNLTVDSTKTLSLSGTTSIGAFHFLTVSGGTFNTGTLVNNGTFNFTGGAVGITGAGGLTIGSGGALGDTVNLLSGQTLNVSNNTAVETTGTLIIGGGRLNATGGVTNTGLLQLASTTGSMNGGTFTNTGRVIGTGRLYNNLANNANGRISVDASQWLFFGGANNNNNANGTIEMTGGTVEFTGTLNNNAGALISGRGTVRGSSTNTSGIGVVNTGNIAFTGTTDVFGKVQNNAAGGITIGGGAIVTFHDDFTNNGNQVYVGAGSRALYLGTATGASPYAGTGTVEMLGDLRPGNSPASVAFGGDLVLGSSATLHIELGGTAAGTQFDQLHVAGRLALDGKLEVSLINGFTPGEGSSFDILDWGSLTGTFSSIQLPALSGSLQWNTSQLYTTRTLSVILPGDFNADGKVDAADYVVWRKTGGAQHAYNVWRAHFGQTAASGVALPSAESLPAVVPEPASAILLLAFGPALGIRRRSPIDSRIPSTRCRVTCARNRPS